MRRSSLSLAHTALVLVLTSSCVRAGEEADLVEGLRPLLACLSGQHETFTVTGEIDIKIDGRRQPVALRLVRFSDDAFDLDLTHADYAIQLRRRRDATAMALPKHKVVFWDEVRRMETIVSLRRASWVGLSVRRRWSPCICRSCKAAIQILLPCC